MAQEKISFNNSLMSLPLATDKALLWQCSCDGITQSWDVDNRALIRVPKGWQPGLFFLRKADADSAKFTVRVYDHKTGTLVATYPSASLDAKVFRRLSAVPNGQSWDTVTMSAGPNAAVSLNTGVYYLTAAGLISEPFQVVDYEADQPPHGELLFSIGNTYNLSEVPYKTGYKQIFGLPGVLCAGEPKDYTESEKSERYGERISYQRQYRVWTIELPSIGEPLAGLLKSLEGHDTVSINDRNRTLLIEPGRIAVTIKEDDCCSLSATLTIDETISEWGTCKSDPELVEQTLVGAGPEYADPADADAVADPYLPDPAADPTYETPGTSPVAGTVINEIVETKECSQGWDKDGIRYRKKTTLVRADGSGGTYEEIIYSDVCEYNPSDLLLPRIISELDTIIGRVGQPLNLPVIDPARFAPAAGQSVAPVVTAKSLPPGLSYSGGRITGTPTVAGNSVALLAVTQPGGASILVEVPVSTAPAAPSVLDVNLSAETSYDSEIKQLTVTVIAPFQPQVKLLAPNGAGQFATANPSGTADTWKAVLPVTTEGKGKIAIRRAGDSGSGITFPVQITPTTPGGSVGTPSLLQVTTSALNANETSTNLIGSGFVQNSDLTPTSDPFGINAWLKIGENRFRQGVITKADIIAWIGAQAGSGGLSAADILLLADYFYRYIGNKEGWVDPATNAPYTQPTQPTLSGGGSGGSGNTQAVINFNASEYREGVGVIGLANNSFGDYFYVRVIGASAGATTPNSAFQLLDRIDGNFTNGTYAFTFATLPTGGLLDPGDYYVDIRIGSDNQTIVRKSITVANTVPYPLPGTENLKWVGPISIAAGTQNVEFRIDSRYSNGTYQPYKNNIIFYPLNAPAGVAFASATEIATELVKGYFSSDANAVSVATKITLVAYVEPVNIYLDITLQPVAVAVKPINGLYVVDANSPTNDHNVLANVTQAVEVIREVYQIVNGAKQYVLSDTAWSPMTVIKTDDNPNGDYLPTGTPVQRYYGLPPAGLPNGNFEFYYTARPAGSQDTTTYIRHAPVAVTINRGSAQPGPWRYSTTTTPAVLAIDYQWFKRTSPQRPDLYLYFKLSTADQYEVAVQVTYNGSTSNKSGYTALQTGDYGNGYAGFYTFGNAITGSTYKLYIRKVGTTTDLLVIDSPAMPSTDNSRTNFYTKP
jgi:hypothetical protein